ncbi:MAG: MFS transporter [Pseudomonadota bacterium]
MQNAAPQPRFLYWEFIVLNGLLFAQNAMALDVFLPVLPLMELEYGLAPEQAAVQQVFTICFYGFALSQLVFAPLSDCFGRKPLLLFGCAVMAVGGIGVLLAGSFASILVWRFVQGAGMGAGRTVNLSALRDLYTGRELGRSVADMYMIFSIVPVVAPLLGVALGIWGWRAAAAVPVVLSILLGLWLWKRYPETLPQDRRQPFRPGTVLRNFGTVLSTRITVLYAIAAGCTFSAILQLLLAATPMGIKLYDAPLFGPVVLATIAALMAVVSRISAVLVLQTGMRVVGHGALLIMTGGSMALWGFGLVTDVPSMWALASLILVVGAVLGAVLANFQAIALGPHEAMAGTAAAVAGATMTFIGTTLQMVFARSAASGVSGLGFALTICLVASLAFVLAAERGRLLRPEPAEAATDG